MISQRFVENREIQSSSAAAASDADTVMIVIIMMMITMTPVMMMSRKMTTTEATFHTHTDEISLQSSPVHQVQRMFGLLLVTL